MADAPRRSAPIEKEGLTFDDVLMIPGHSTVHPKDTDVRSKLTNAPVDHPQAPPPPKRPNATPALPSHWRSSSVVTSSPNAPPPLSR